jgi:hypothetical protein
VKNVAIFMCHRSGIAARPWAEAGYECFCIDLQHSIRRARKDGRIWFMWGDCRTWVPPEDIRGRIAFYAAEPPCTHVTVAGARDFRTKGTALLRDSLEMFSACYTQGCWSGAPFRIENPVGKFSDHMGKPDHTFQPWEYGDPWTKLTCLWVGNGYVMPTKTRTTPPEGTTQKIWLMPPSEERADLRSETPQAFARAEFHANGRNLLEQAA